MKTLGPERPIIVVLKDEDLFAELRHHFSARQFELIHATDKGQALALGSIRNLRMALLPLDPEGIELAEALKHISIRGVSVIGTGTVDEAVSEADPNLFDGLAPRSDMESVLDKVRELLKERRKQPRVAVEFPVGLGDRGEGVVREVSATALVVNTMMPLSAGDQVEVEIGWGEEPVQFEAVVGRVDRALLGQSSLVLHLPEREAEARRYLDQLVQKILEVQHFLDGTRSEEDPLAPADEPHEEELPPFGEEGPEQEVRGQEHEGLESRYVLLEPLGRWGVGEVHRARHWHLKRRVAIKILRQDLRHDRVAAARLEQEAKVAIEIACPGVVDIIDYGKDPGRGPFYVMEDLDGETLASAMESGRALTHLDVTRLGVHLATSLAAAHMLGFGHFDLCPENIFLQRWSEWRLWPVLINVAGRLEEVALTDSHPAGASFWPPEAPSAPVNPAYDIYALASVLESLLARTAGPPPGDNGEVADWAQKQQDDGLELVLRRAKAQLPRARTPDMMELARDLASCLSRLGPPPVTSPEPVIEVPPDPARVFGGELPPVRGMLARAMALGLGSGRFREQEQQAEDPQAEQAQTPLPAPDQPDPTLDPGAPEPPVPELELEAELPDRAPEAELSFDSPPQPEAELSFDSPPQPEAEDPHAAVIPDADFAEDPEPEPPLRKPARSTMQVSPIPSKGTPALAVWLLVLAVLLIGVVLVLMLRSQQRPQQPASPEPPAVAAVDPAPAVNPPASAPAEPPTAEPKAAPAEPTPAPADVKPAAAEPEPPAAEPTPAPAEPSPAAAPTPAAPASLSPAQRKAAHYRALREGKKALRKGKLAEAEAQFQRAVELRDTAKARTQLATALEKTNKLDQAIQQIIRAAALESDVAWYQDKLGRLYIKAGQKDPACQAFRAALKIRPKYGSARGNLKKHCQ